MNADTYQNDDGYEMGKLEDMCVHNQPIDRRFWEINPEKLPDGFRPLLQVARDGGIALSLWFAPSATRAYEDWRESADVLLNFHRTYGICCFKLDGVIFGSYDAEENFGKMLKAIHEESEGRISVNLDVTNGLRGGLYKYAEYGAIFLENR